jgi:hypothetical protein
MSDRYFNAVVSAVKDAGGNPDAVARSRTDACESAGNTPAQVAGWELELQYARELARLSVDRLLNVRRVH